MTLQEQADAIIHRAIHRAPFVIVCAWCPDAREQTQRAIDAGHLVSHTICPTCLREWEVTQ